MKIGIIGPAYPLRGGLADFDERLAREFQEQGHDVTLYSYSLQYPSFLFPGKTQYTDAPPPADLHIKTVINSVNPLNWLSVGNNIRRDKPDLLIVRYWLPFMGPALGTILRRVRRNNHTRIVAIADNVIPHEKRPGDLPFTKYFIKPVHAFVTMSEDVMGDLRKLTDKPAIRLHHPVYDNYGAGVPRDIACKELGLDPAQKYLLFFGFIRKYKGLDLLLEAMAEKAVVDTNAKLIIAGEYYGDREFYESVIDRLNLKDRIVSFTDFIPNERVRYYFSAADLVVLPYRSATQSGITQVAYHFQKPMVATNVGGLPEAVPEGKVGFVCEPEPASIAEAVSRFFQPHSLPHLQEALEAERRKYSWNTFAEEMLGLVKDLI